MFNLSLAHLYPKLLNIYGDTGNVTALRRRCEWRGIKLNVNEINSGDDINPENFDMFFIGGGQDLQQITVAAELQKQKNALQDAAEMNAVFLAICGGYQLFGEYYQLHEGKRLEGIKLLDAYTIAGQKRFIGNVSASCKFINPNSLVGFENHSGLTFLKEGTEPLAKIQTGHGNNGQDKSEGARKRNVFGTYLHGSLLPKNPHFTDYLIELALEKKYKEKIVLDKIDDEIEYLTHNSLIGKKY